MQREGLFERLRQTFRPEFLNRVDEVVIFQPLGQEQAQVIPRLQMNKLATHLLEQAWCCRHMIAQLISSVKKALVRLREYAPCVALLRNYLVCR